MLLFILQRIEHPKAARAAAAVFLLGCLGLALNTRAQGPTDKWYFGNKAGLDFSSGTPVPLLDGQLNAAEGSSSISDANGQLLFYTDGITVFNKDHVPMQNGQGLAASPSSTQAALIVKQPGGTGNIYFIFTMFRNFCYSVVDMSLDNQRGAVVLKNQLLFYETTEKLTAVHHANGSDIWVLAHSNEGNSFYAYLLTAAGLSAPQISRTGYYNKDQNSYQGYMKASHNGRYLAQAILPLGIGELFCFNNSTGALCFLARFQLTAPTADYGVEFSPADSKLYFASIYAIVQYDLSNPDPQAIQNSRYVVATNKGLGALQLGSDKKIYVSGGTHLSVINNPENAGAACGYQDTALYLGGRSGALGLPNFVQSLFSPTAPQPNTCPCDISKAKIKNIPNVFTPNGDDFNNFFRIDFENVDEMELEVYNRWGQLLYRGTNPEMPWDGLVNGKEPSAGTYYYLLRYKSASDRDFLLHHGTVLILLAEWK